LRRKSPQEQTAAEWLADYDSTEERTMPKVMENSGGNFKLLPAGSHAAVCTMVADLGLQNTAYMGKPKLQQKVYIRFQVPAERVEWEKDGQTHEGPMSIGKTYTASLSEKANLRKDLESWRSRQFTQDELAGFELFNIIGKPCLISVVHDTGEDGKTRAYIQSISALPKGMSPPKHEGDLLRYDAQTIGDHDKLPEWIRKKIAEQVKPQNNGATPPPAAAADEFHDDIPF
jgi:hypothetical protein